MSAESHLQEAIQAHQRGDLSVAQQLYRQVLQSDPRNATAVANLAVVAISDRDYALAERYLREALSIRTDDAGVYSNLGVVLRAQGRLEEALAVYARALRLKPDYADVYHNLGNALTDQARPEEAIAAYRKAIELKPDDAEAYNHLGDALSELKRSDEALLSYERALAINPDLADAHLNRGILHLRNGRFAEGWPDYEYRFSTWRYAAARPASRFPVWSGEPIEGKSILVLPEQGLGDTIQFVRYLPLLAERGAEVTFSTPPRLARLLRPFTKQVRMATALDGNERMDFEICLASLPYRLGTELYTIPRKVPYFFAEHDLVARWRAKIGRHGCKVGICWQGNPNYRDPARSIPLTEFAALAAVPEVRLISLQKFHGLDQLARLAGMTVELLGDDLDAGNDAFIDTAAAMSALDLVVTSDASIAHLAGALGRPVWLALKYAPHWAWMLDRNDSPWYPSMRLFRQAERGKWDGVFSAMAKELRQIANPGLLSLAAGIDVRPLRPKAPISWGELLDKIAILEIKVERLTSPEARQNARRELELLCALTRQLHEFPPQLSELKLQLRGANRLLWKIEDAIRDKEARKEFDADFIILARSMYTTNDERGRIKREIDVLLKSGLVEEKQYTPYRIKADAGQPVVSTGSLAARELERRRR